MFFYFKDTILNISTRYKNEEIKHAIRDDNDEEKLRFKDTRPQQIGRPAKSSYGYGYANKSESILR